MRVKSDASAEQLKQLAEFSPVLDTISHAHESRGATGWVAPRAARQRSRQAQQV